MLSSRTKNQNQKRGERMDLQTVAVLVVGAYALGQFVNGLQWGNTTQVREIEKQIGKVLRMIAKPSTRKPRARKSK